MRRTQLGEVSIAETNSTADTFTPNVTHCALVTSGLRITPENVVFWVPARGTEGVFVVEEVRNGSDQRFLGFVRPDGTCREESSMRVQCDDTSPGHGERSRLQ